MMDQCLVCCGEFLVLGYVCGALFSREDRDGVMMGPAAR